MAYKVISFIVSAVCHAQYVLAAFKDVTQFGKTNSKTFVPTGQMPRLSGAVPVGPAAVAAPENAEAITGSGFPVHQVFSSNHFGSTLHMGERLKEQDEALNEAHQHLRARVQNMPLTDVKDAQYESRFGSLMCLMASVSLVASFGIATIRKYMANGQQALHSTVQSQISIPLRSRPSSAPVADAESFSLDDLQHQAGKLNPVVGCFDPLDFSQQELWGQSQDATFGSLCHVEINHGRVAMAAFVGYIVHENGIRWPWFLTGDMPDCSSFHGLSVPEVWDKIPLASQLQIILTIGLFQIWPESTTLLSALSEKDGQKLYRGGGKPGYSPILMEPPHPVPINFYDACKLNNKQSDEWESEKLLARWPIHAERHPRILACASDGRPELQELIEPVIDDMLRQTEQETMLSLLAGNIDVLMQSQFLPRLEARREACGDLCIDNLVELVVTFLEEFTNRMQGLQRGMDAAQAEVDKYEAELLARAEATQRERQGARPRRRSTGTAPAARTATLPDERNEKDSLARENAARYRFMLERMLGAAHESVDRLDELLHELHFDLDPGFFAHLQWEFAQEAAAKNRKMLEILEVVVERACLEVEQRQPPEVAILSSLLQTQNVHIRREKYERYLAPASADLYAGFQSLVLETRLELEKAVRQGKQIDSSLLQQLRVISAEVAEYFANRDEIGLS